MTDLRTDHKQSDVKLLIETLDQSLIAAGSFFHDDTVQQPRLHHHSDPYQNPRPKGLPTSLAVYPDLDLCESVRVHGEEQLAQRARAERIAHLCRDPAVVRAAFAHVNEEHSKVDRPHQHANFRQVRDLRHKLLVLRYCQHKARSRSKGFEVTLLKSIAWDGEEEYETFCLPWTADWALFCSVLERVRIEGPGINAGEHEPSLGDWYYCVLNSRGENVNLHYRPDPLRDATDYREMRWRVRDYGHRVLLLRKTLHQAGTARRDLVEAVRLARRSGENIENGTQYQFQTEEAERVAMELEWDDLRVGEGGEKGSSSLSSWLDLELE